jgi:hypothetical protein
MKKKEDRKEGVRKEDSLNSMVNIQLAIEKVRVNSQIRISHLALNKQEDLVIEAAYKKLLDLESWVDTEVANIIKSHPAYFWFSQVKGIGNENIAKVIGLLDIDRANSVSSIWKYCGYSVENGVSPKRKKGEKTTYNTRLRTLCWRMATSLKRATGKYYIYYCQQKEEITKRIEGQGITIIPTSEEKKFKKENPERAYFTLGHVENRAVRKMIKLFLAHLAIVWAEAVGKDLKGPYAIEHLKHTHYLDPWEFIEPKKGKKASQIK